MVSFQPAIASRGRLALLAASAVVAIGIAAAMIFGVSGAAFTAQTQNPGNAWETGQVTLTDDAQGVALFDARGITPGYTETQDILVTYTGPQTANLSFAADVGGALAPFLTIEATRNGTLVYTGPLAAFSDSYTMASGSTDTWVFTVSLPADTGSEAEGLVANATFIWTATVSE